MREANLPLSRTANRLRAVGRNGQRVISNLQSIYHFLKGEFFIMLLI
jgi:hypothetical protein